MTSKITGYRDLSDAEINTINEIKAFAQEIGDFIHALSYPVLPGPMVDLRWLNIAKTDLQKGFMALSRAVAQPTTF